MLNTLKNFFNQQDIKDTVRVGDLDYVFAKAHGSGNLHEVTEFLQEHNIDVLEYTTKIYPSMFVNSTLLKHVDIPDSVDSIGNGAFENCNKLESIIISDSVTSIGERAFYDCDSLKSIDYSGTKEQWHGLSKYSNSIPKICIIHCTDGDINVN